MTKNQFSAIASITMGISWVKYSGHTKTFYVCCSHSHAGVELQELAKGSYFKIVIG